MIFKIVSITINLHDAFSWGILMHVSSVGYLNQKGLRTVEDYKVQTKYDNASLFGQIEHKPVKLTTHEKKFNLFSVIKNLCTDKKEISAQQVIDMIG